MLWLPKEDKMFTKKPIHKKICYICGNKSKNPKFDMPCLVFNFLENGPLICEKCLFEKLTGKRLKWGYNFLDEDITKEDKP